MPTAREALLDAARAALSARPWPAVRMVEVAAAAGVSRQTLHNEFGGKDGLAAALVAGAAAGYLSGAERALAAPGSPGDRLAALAAWTVRATRADALVAALLTGHWDARLPRPAALSRHLPPRARRHDGAGPPSPAELLGRVRDRAVAVLTAEHPARDSVATAVTCELALRLALSYALVPPPPGLPGDGMPLVRNVVDRLPDVAA